MAARPKPGADDEAPTWLYSLNPAGRPEREGDPPAAVAETLAVAAAMPVQVRRSRVPVLSVDTRRTGATPAGTLPGSGKPSDRLASAPPRRLPRLAVVFALLILLAVLAYLVYRLVA